MMTFVLNYDVETNQNIPMNFILTHTNLFELSVHKTLKSYCHQQNCDILIHEHNTIYHNRTRNQWNLHMLDIKINNDLNKTQQKLFKYKTLKYH